MPFSGTAPNKTFARNTGLYTGSTAWQQTEAAGRGIRADDADTHDQDLAAAINTSLQVDGSNKLTSSIPCNGYGLTGAGVLGSVAEITVASATTTNVLGAAALFVAVSGTTTITSLGTGTNQIKFVRFTGALTLTHNATSLILPGGISIVTEAGDTMIIASDGSSNVRVLVYQFANGRLVTSGAVSFTGIISPSQITGNQDDYAPTGHATANVFRLSTDASRNITGLAGGASGRIVIIHNVGSNNIVLKDDTTSTAANRFALTGDMTLAPDVATILQYDGTSSRWRSLGGTVDKATAANLRAGTADKVVTADVALSAADWVTLTDAATIAVDHAAGYNFTVTITDNRAFGAPSNAKVGWPLNIRVKQDATGSRVPTWNAVYDFGDYGTPVLSTGANNEDLVTFLCITSSKYAFLGLRKRID